MNDHLRPQGIIAFDLGWRESDLNLTFFDDVEGAAAYIEHYDFETTRVFDLNGYEYSLSLEPARGWFFRYEKTALTKTERQPLDELRALLNRCLRSELPSEVDDLRDPEVYAVLRTHRAHSPQKRRPESDVAIVLGRRNGFHDWWIDLDSCRVSGADVTFNIAYPVGGWRSTAKDATFDVCVTVHNLTSLVAADWAGIGIQSVQSLECDESQLEWDLNFFGKVVGIGNELSLTFAPITNEAACSAERDAEVVSLDGLQPAIRDTLFPAGSYRDIERLDVDAGSVVHAIRDKPTLIGRREIVDVYQVCVVGGSSVDADDTMRPAIYTSRFVRTFSRSRSDQHR